MYIPRLLSEKLLSSSAKYPVVSLSGPRQSGKTTLLKQLFPEYRYVSLENPDDQEFAQKDPRHFLKTYDRHVILDEVQRVPHLFNYLQGKVDADKINGQYILSGSQDYLLMQGITQSLAGRVSLFKLFPFSFGELKSSANMPESFEKAIFQGFYPRVFEHKLEPDEFYANYFETYVQRDVRSLTAVHDLSLFRNFVKLCAGRIGQPLNMQTLAADTGVSAVTVKAWLSILETSHLVFLLPPYFRNFNKRLIKSSKLFFSDVGLAAWLLGVRKPEDLTVHFARGNLFENMVVADFLKQQYERGQQAELYFWRDSNQHEIDVLAERSGVLIATEVKSGATINHSFFDNLIFFKKNAGDQPVQTWLIYGGDADQSRENGEVRSWKFLEGIY